MVFSNEKYTHNGFAACRPINLNTINVVLFVASRFTTEAARRAWDDFEDCLVAVAAEKIGADFIITRDAKGFSRSKIKALDADAFLEWMRQKRGRSYAEMRVTREMVEEACRRASFDA